MDHEAMTRMQIRVILTVFRAEMGRLPRMRSTEARSDALRRLRLRSLNLLAEARARVSGAASGNGNGHARVQQDLLVELDAARDEIVAQPEPVLNGHRRRDRQPAEPAARRM